MRIVLPKQFGPDDRLILCPQDPYINVMNMRKARFADIQKQIKSKNLTSEQEKMLHVAIQGYFREWFVQTSSYKPITDLVRIIDQEF